MFDALDTIEQTHGAGSLSRVRKFLELPPAERAKRPVHQRKARHIVPDLSTPGGWMDFERYPETAKLGRCLLAHHEEIQEEVARATARFDAIPYYETSGVRNDKWRSLRLSRYGRRVESARDFPVTMACLDECAQGLIYTLGEVFFSVLAPGCHIPAHCDQSNMFVCFGYCVFVPPDCGLMVAGDTREFRERESYLFDHSFEHVAWNRSNQTRVNLLLDIWHPDLAIAEREALHVVFSELFDDAHDQITGQLGALN